MDKLNSRKKRDLANCKKGEGKDATTLHEYESKQIAKLRQKVKK